MLAHKINIDSFYINLEIESTMLVHKELVALLVLASYPGRVKALVRGYIGASLVNVKTKLLLQQIRFWLL